MTYAAAANGLRKRNAQGHAGAALPTFLCVIRMFIPECSKESGLARQVLSNTYSSTDAKCVLPKTQTPVLEGGSRY